MTSSATTNLIGRPHSSKRFSQTVFGVLFLAIGLGLLVKGTWWFGLPAVALGLYGLSDLRRKVTVTPDRLLVQGRVQRREVALADLTRIALSPVVQLWVATAQGTSFYVRMVTPFEDLKHPGIHQFVEQLRARALEAGAHVQPETEDLVPAPPGTSPWFSA